MIVNTVTEAKAHFSALLELVSKGEEVIISRAGKPTAILEPYRAENRPRFPGLMKGKIEIAPDFNKLPDDIAAAFGVDVE